MTDKVQKIREFLVGIAEADGVNTILAKAIEKKTLPYIDSMQEEPKKCMYARDNYTDEDRKVLCDGCQEECKFKPVEWSEEDDSILKEIIDSVTACDATTGTISVCFEKHEAKVRWLKSLKERFNK